MGTPVLQTKGMARVAELTVADATHIAVGTGTNPPVAGDTQLQEETNRQALTSSFRVSNIFQVRSLFTNSNLPSTLEEIGLFLNGTGSPNSGDLLVHTLETFVKGSADLLVVMEITIQET